MGKFGNVGLYATNNILPYWFRNPSLPVNWYDLGRNKPWSHFCLNTSMLFSVEPPNTVMVIFRYLLTSSQHQPHERDPDFCQIDLTAQISTKSSLNNVQGSRCLNFCFSKYENRCIQATKNYKVNLTSCKTFVHTLGIPPQTGNLAGRTNNLCGEIKVLVCYLVKCWGTFEVMYSWIWNRKSYNVKWIIR